MRRRKCQTFTFTMIGGLLSLAIGAPAVAAERPSAGPTDAARRCALVDFDEAAVLPGEEGKSWTLIVSGMKPATNVAVKLLPVTYIRQPEYWLIEVVGCSSGIGLPVLTPYATKLDVTSTLGTLGIEVQGSNGNQVIPVSRSVTG